MRLSCPVDDGARKEKLLPGPSSIGTATSPHPLPVPNIGPLHGKIMLSSGETWSRRIGSTWPGAVSAAPWEPKSTPVPR
jgi:hypothetical protein